MNPYELEQLLHIERREARIAECHAACEVLRMMEQEKKWEGSEALKNALDRLKDRLRRYRT